MTTTHLRVSILLALTHHAPVTLPVLSTSSLVLGTPFTFSTTPSTPPASTIPLAECRLGVRFVKRAAVVGGAKFARARRTGRQAGRQEEEGHCAGREPVGDGDWQS